MFIFFLVFFCYYIVCFKQKTAYEMRISDWSSDVCSSELTFAFRKLSSAFSPWIMGGAALIALVHDIAVPLGIFSVLGNYYGVEISAVFIAAALTILG